MQNKDNSGNLPGMMPQNLPDNAPQPAGFNAVEVAQSLLFSGGPAALGTLDRNFGHPVTTLINVAHDEDGSPILLTSSLSSHTANMEHDARVSILLTQIGKGDPLAHPRLTVLGRVERISDAALRQRVKARFLNRHPKAALYADFPDFSFWLLKVESGHLNGGFARAADLSADQLLKSRPYSKL